ncbi:transketolase [Alphaproteobacteria bacterium]|nr:transketolase [Alphaproteobacteria bacterium]
MKLLLQQKQLIEKSSQIRLSILDAIRKAKKGHIGGSFSIVDILVLLYYGGVLNHKPRDPDYVDRDRFILSKGHAGIALYAVLSDLGYFSNHELDLLNNESMLGEHPDQFIPGVETISGSLGHGLPIATGMALADKFDKKENRKTVVLLGDGECYEGSVWEAAAFASHHNLKNLCAIIDRNSLITHGSTEEINALEPLDRKWSSFGWSVYNTDAHDFKSLLECFNQIEVDKSHKPSVLIAKSIKGKGVSFMENIPSWHHGGVDEDNFIKAKAELEKK